MNVEAFSELPHWREKSSREWMDEAACVGMDTSEFFPNRGAFPQDGAAVQVCATCPVRLDCLLYALRNNIQHGVWGGFSTKKRTRLRHAYKIHESSEFRFEFHDQGLVVIRDGEAIDALQHARR